jgi:hypothetical protein
VNPASRITPSDTDGSISVESVPNSSRSTGTPASRA